MANDERSGKNLVKHPVNERTSAFGWIAMALILIACVVAVYFQLDADHPDQRCDPRDLDGNPVNLRDAAAKGVGVTIKNNCYTQPETK